MHFRGESNGPAAELIPADLPSGSRTVCGTDLGVGATTGLP